MWCCRPTRPLTSPRRRCWVRCTSTWPRPRTSPRRAGWPTGRESSESNTGRFPTTEEVFSALGVVVNKGNVGALEEITDETYQAVAGRQGQFVDLIPRLAELTSGLNRQVNDIIAAVDGLNRFSSILARDKDNLGRTLDTPARRASGAQQATGQHRRRVRRTEEAGDRSPRTCSRKPRRTSPQTSKTCIRLSRRSTTTRRTSSPRCSCC